MLDITHRQGNTNRNHDAVSPHACQNGYRQKDKREQVWLRLWRKVEHGALLVGMQIGAGPMENRIEVPRQVKNRTSLSSSNPTSGTRSKRNEIMTSKNQLHSHVYWSTNHNRIMEAT